MRASRQLNLLPPSVRRRRKPPLALEFRTHCALAKTMYALVFADWEWTHFPAGEKRTKASGGRLKAMGLHAGWPDFLLVDPEGQWFCLELKRGDASLTFEQERFKASMAKRGTPYAIARSYNEAIEILTDWGAMRQMTVMA